MIREFIRGRVLFPAGMTASLAWPIALFLAWLSLTAVGPLSPLALAVFVLAVVASVFVFGFGAALIIAEPIVRRRRGELTTTWSPVQVPEVEDSPWSAAVADVPENVRDIRWYQEPAGEVQ